MSDSGDYTPLEQTWTPIKGQTQGVFDPTQVAWSAAPNYEGMPTEYYDKSGNMIGYLGHGDNVMSTQGLNFVDQAGQPSSVSDKHSLYQLTDDNGNLLYNNPDFYSGISNDQWTTQQNDNPASRQLSSMISMNAPSPGILQDPLFRNFLLSAAAMGGAAAFAPAMGAEAGALGSTGDFIAADMAASQAGQGAFNAAASLGMPLDEAVTSGLIAADGTLTDAGAAALMGETAAGGASGSASGLTGSDLLKYGQMGLKGIGALSSLAGAVGNVAGNLPGSGGSGATAFPVTNSTNYASPLEKVSNQYLSTGQANEKPFEIKRLEMLHPQAKQIDPQILDILANKGAINHSSGVAPTESAKSSSGYPELSLNSSGDIVGYADGGEVQDQGWMYDHPTHVAEFKTGTTGNYVRGKGDGQADLIPAMLADGEFVFDSSAVSTLGNGSSDSGAKLLDAFRESLREHTRSAPSDKIPPKVAPLTYMKEAMKKVGMK